MGLWLLKVLTPFTRWIGSVHAPWTIKKITGKDYYKLRRSLKAGDIILSNTFGSLSNILNPSCWNHGALYIGKDKDGICNIIESVGAGVVKKDLVSHLLTKDEVIVLKSNSIDRIQRNEITEIAEEFIGEQYDFMFDDNEAFYCFELIVEILGNFIEPILFKKTSQTLGHKYYDSDTFLKMEEFKVVYDSRV